jgi:hypothetical protein
MVLTNSFQLMPWSHGKSLWKHQKLLVDAFP